jgi:hypothetical protein
LITCGNSYLSHFKSRVLYGSTGVDKSKKRFDFEAEISKYYKSSARTVNRLISTNKKNGVVNTMILNQLTYEKSKIEYYKQVKVSDYLKTIVSLYNEGLDDLNRIHQV